MDCEGFVCEQTRSETILAVSDMGPMGWDDRSSVVSASLTGVYHLFPPSVYNVLLASVVRGEGALEGEGQKILPWEGVMS